MKRHPFALVWMFMASCSALGADIPRQTGNPTFDIRLWAPICAALGGLITAIVNVVRWSRERSSASRKAEAVSNALKLREFIDSEHNLRAALGVESESQAAISSAKRELRVVLAQLDASPRPMSKLRRLMLFYAPKGPKAWLAHSLFYAAFIFSGVLVIAFCSGDLEDVESAEAIRVFLYLALLVVLFERWAALEQRISNNLALKPRAIGPFCWYPANSGYGFLAQIMLVLGFAVIASYCAELVSPGAFLFMPLPRWELVPLALIRCAFLPVGYVWSEMEYNCSKQPLVKKRNFNEFLAMTLRAPTTEGLVGSIALAAVTAWNVILLLNLRSIPAFASFPSTTGFDPAGEVGLAGAIWSYLALLLFVGWLPWLAIYRGCWALYKNANNLSSPIAAETEDSNG